MFYSTTVVVYHVYFSRSSLFRGAQSTLICVAVSNFVYFYTFNALKRWAYIGGGHTNRGPKSSSTLRDLMFACAAGILNTIFISL